MITAGVVTILCHAGAGIDPRDLREAADRYTFWMTDTGAESISTFLAPDPAYGTILAKGPAPKAESDHTSTPEEIPVSINVLSNDTRGTSEGDEDDDEEENDEDSEIDPGTVDLNPDTDGVQSAVATDAGSFTVNESGVVTFSPFTNFFGNTAIQYTVKSKGNERSNVATLSIDVVNVNDAPAITGTNNSVLNAVAGKPVTITLSDLIVVDPDNAQSDLILIVLEGDNYNVLGTTITPKADVSGTMPVKVQVDDGVEKSAAFTLNFNVTQENVKPVITGQKAPATTPEDVPLIIGSEYLDVTDPDDAWPADFTIQVADGDNYTVSEQTITPAENFSGALVVPVTVNDGESTSDAFNLQVTVTAVNDPPVITGQDPNPLAVGNNQTFAIGTTNLQVTDPDNTYPTDFTIEVLAGANYTFNGASVTPSPGFSGPLTVNVAVRDLADRSDPFAFSVSVAPNATPVITGHTALSTNEDTSLTIALSNLSVTDPDNPYPTGFSLAIAAGANYTVAGNTITPSPNFAGELTVPVTVNDGTNTSAPFSVTITVNAVNDVPVITGHVPLSVAENQSITLDLSHVTVVDPDGQSLTLSVISSPEYSVSGNVVTPPAGFHGNLSVGVMVSDGVVNSAPFNVQITVTPVNDPPAITAQRSIVIAEGAAISLSAADVTVSDPDNTGGFTLAVQPGSNYTFTGTTVTPVTDFFGDLHVNVVVNDGMANSAVFPLLITVTPVNDPPVISGHTGISMSEDTPRAIALGELIVSDPDNTYPTGFTLIVSPGLNYSVSGNAVTPAPDYSGPLNVQVQVNDGVLTSNPFTLALTVLPVNDKPVITGQVPLETAEDTPVSIALTHLDVLDVDNVYPGGFTLAVSSNANYSVSGTTITPATDFNGTLNVPVTVNDGAANSEPFLFQIQVGNANDAPLITGQSTLSTNEETQVTLALSHLTVSDPDNPFPTGFTLLVSPGTNYTVSGTTITPAVNFAGVLTVPVRVNDGVNNSPTFDFQLQVNQINDPPAFAAIANQQIAENTPAGSATITGITKGPFEDYQQLTFVASSNNTSVIADPVIQYNGTATTAVLSYVVKPNTSGVVTITIVAIDNGSNTAPNQNSYTSSFQVNVTEINTAPTLNVINTITIMEDAEQQNVPLGGISPGPGETQPVTVTASTNKPEFFDLFSVAYTSPAVNGLLQFKTKPNVSGTAEVSVTVTDNGSGVAPHVNSITRKFSVVIQPVNDAPYFTSQPVTVAVVQEEYVYTVTASDPDGEKVAISATAKPSWLTLSNPASNGTAILSGRPPAGVLGNVDVTLRVNDAVTSASQSFVIYVNVRPTLTPLSLISEEDLPVTFQADFFASGYTDQNENPLNAVKIIELPKSGSLLLSETAVKAGDTISSAQVSQLTYDPAADFFGMDSFTWNAFDGYNFSLNPARVDISILSINDAPSVLLQADTLRYEVNGEPALLDPLIDIVDVDDDTLASATIAFRPGSFRPEEDLLQFQAVGSIRGSFDYQSGTLHFTGTAPLTEYINALRSVKYLYQNTTDPLLEPKGITFTVNDGKVSSEPAEKVIMLQYTFVEFEIPSGFTPNGDQANDTWIIDRPGGGLQEMTNAVISVYNKQGVLVYRAKGFERPWDGTMRGELLPADTYFYTIDLQLRNNKTYKGIVTILR